MDIEYMDEYEQGILCSTSDKEEITTYETTERGIQEINREYFVISDEIRKLENELEGFNRFFKDTKEIALLLMTLPFGVGTSAVTFLSFFQSTFEFSTMAILVALSVAAGSVVSFGSTIISCKLFPSKIQDFLIKHSLQIETIYNKILEIRNEISKKRDRLIELDIEKETLNNTFANKEKLFNRRKEKIEEFNKLFIQNLRLCNNVDYEDVTEDKKEKRGRRLIRGK